MILSKWLLSSQVHIARARTYNEHLKGLKSLANFLSQELNAWKCSRSQSCILTEKLAKHRDDHGFWAGKEKSPSSCIFPDQGWGPNVWKLILYNDVREPDHLVILLLSHSHFNMIVIFKLSNDITFDQNAMIVFGIYLLTILLLNYY